MSDQPNPTTPTTTPPTAQSLDEILNKLEKTTGSIPNIAPATTPTPTVEAPGITTEVKTEETSVAPAPPIEMSAPPVQNTFIEAPVSPAPPEPLPIPEPSEPVVTTTDEPIAAEPVVSTTESITETPGPISEPTPMMPSQEVSPTSIEPEMPVVSTPEPTPMPEVQPPQEMPPVTPTTPLPDLAPEPQTEAPKKTSAAGKVIAGVIGVFLLAGAAGAGIFLTQQPQDTRAPAASQTNTQNTTEVTTGSDLVNDTVLMSGKSCLNEVSGTGNVFITNTKEEYTFRIYLGPQAKGYSLNVPVGEYVVYYKTADGKKVAGFTSEDHKLKTITAAGGEAFVADVCDERVDTNTIPKLGEVITTQI